MFVILVDYGYSKQEGHQVFAPILDGYSHMSQFPTMEKVREYHDHHMLKNKSWLVIDIRTGQGEWI